ncbi:NUDIX domain protein [compost metagenome]
MTKFSNYNPPTVMVPLIPIQDGILVIRRALPHGYGKICLPGGFQEMGDSWRKTLKKETHEESGIQTDDNWKIFDYESIEGDTKNLLFASYEGPEPEFTPWTETQLAAQDPRETLEVLLWNPDSNEEWAFPAHEAAARKFYNRLFSF